MTERAMLDASMLAHKTVLARMRTLMETDPDSLRGLVVSDAFVRLIETAGERRDNDSTLDLLSLHFRIARRSIDLLSTRELLRRPEFKQHVLRYRYPPSAELSAVYRALLDETGNEQVAQIVFEEWEYLIYHSWLFSKTRAVYDHLVNSGATAVYVTKKKLEQAVRETTKSLRDVADSAQKRADRLVARTIKKPRAQHISPNDRVRALAKWVAVGGGAATSLMPPVAALTVSATASLFLLYDP